MSDFNNEAAFDRISEDFYEDVLEATAAERQAFKKQAVQKLIAIRVPADLAKKQVQTWFEAIREQQRG